MRENSLFVPAWRRGAGRRGSRAAAVAGMCCLAALLAACGSSGTSQGASTSSVSALRLACLQVSAVLSDGPGPSVDPIGYAEAQILPLRKVHTKNKALEQAIKSLDRAYAAVYSTDDSAAAKKAESKESRRMNAICPGAAP